MLMLNQNRKEQFIGMRISPIIWQFQGGVCYYQIAMFFLKFPEEGVDDLMKQKQNKREKLPSKYWGKMFFLKFDFCLHVHQFCAGLNDCLWKHQILSIILKYSKKENSDLSLSCSLNQGNNA